MKISGIMEFKYFFIQGFFFFFPNCNKLIFNTGHITQIRTCLLIVYTVCKCV